MRRGAVPVLAALLLAAGAVQAQQAEGGPGASPRLHVDVTRDTTGAIQSPVVRASGLMSDGSFEGSLRNGFPVRFGFQLSLVRDGALFDRLVREVEWEAVVVLDPVTSVYQLIRPADGSVQQFSDLRTLDSALSIP